MCDVKKDVMTDLQKASQDLGISLRQFRRHALAGRVPGVQFTKGGHLRMRGPWTARRVQRLKESLPLRSKPKKAVVTPRVANPTELKLEAKRLWRECLRLAQQDPAVKTLEKEILQNLWNQTRESAKAARMAHQKLITLTARRIKSARLRPLGAG